MYNRKIEALSLIFALFCYYSCQGQFNKTIDENSSSGAVFINNKDEILHGVNGKVTKFDLTGNISWSKELIPYADNGILQKVSMHHTSRFLNNGDFLFTNSLRPLDLNKISFSRLNSSGFVDFTRVMKYPPNYSTVSQSGIQKIPKSIEFDSGNYILVNHLSDPDEINYYYSFVKFNNQGELVWHKEFKDLLPGTPITIINKLNNNRFALIRNGRFDLNNEEPHIENIIQILNENLSELKTIQIDGMVEKIIFKNNHYYILVFWYGFRNSQSDLTNSLICLNQNFEPIWAKEYIPSSRIIHLTLSKSDTGFLMSESAGLNSKMNLIAIDNNGDVLESKVLATPFSSNAPSVSDNFFIHEGNHFFDATEPKQLTCSSNTLKSLSCYAPNDCIEVINFDAKVIFVEDFFLEPISLDIEVTDAFIETVDSEPKYYDSCNEDFVDYPVPLFDIPDTVCINELITVSNLQNENAESVNWFLPGSNIEFNSSSNPPPFFYSEPGTYPITQQTTDEGCPNEFSQEIVVIAPIELEVETDIILCNEEPFIIDAENNLVTDYLWDNGDTVSTLLTNQEGTYRLQLTDEYCSQSIDFNISYFDFDRIDPSFIPDTVICLQKPLSLGFIFAEYIEYTWGDGELAYPRQITQSGVYKLYTSLEGCNMESSTFIEAEDCSTKIFMPNTFSPNKDGINDDIYPLGSDFEVLYFAVFDKWGNKVHQSLSPWNGSYRNKDSSAGVFAYMLEVRNTKLGQIEKFNGTFMLTR